MEAQGTICHCSRMGRRQMQRFLQQSSAKNEQELPQLIDFQRLTGAGLRCTGCSLDLAEAFADERRRHAIHLSKQPLLWPDL